ncbi:diguanylate cyclase (GGDEF) domain-containing protein [Cohaesibacter marisflavi]|uniref:diguanylate cyclase n=2 Tax=Cohaesibacter marisflavi TaxID=655353 RepID=A0A1I5GL44_9HYPH|nr:diguanylate cyclase (GGDEF) domain-containing protein [Cohaesibacter marisflavi]
MQLGARLSMLNALDIASIYACLFLSLLVSASTMAVVWRTNTDEPAAGYWLLAYVLGVVAAAFLALQEILGSFAPALCTAVVITSNLGMIAGFRAFNGHKTPTWPFFVAPFVYLILAGAAPWLYSDPNMNALVQSLFVMGVAFSNAHLVFNGAGNRALPMAVPTSIVLVVHGIIRGFVVFFTLTQPAAVINGRMEAGWWKLFLLEIFFNTTMMAISTVILIKDKAEKRHRIASETDDLTGISNRRAFVKGINGVLPDSGPDAIMAILDIDHFKTINDTYGHDAGDKVLIDFVKTTKLQLPTSALMGRMGGEEFAIYLGGKGYDHAAILERVRRKIEQTSFDYKGAPISFTLSIGYVSVKTVGKSFDHLFTAADYAMYLAKKDGRNRVLAYKPSMRIREVMDDNLMTAGVFSEPTMISKAV